MRPPLIVLADDLTGACEVAGLAFARGLTARVTTNRAPPLGAETELLVLDTETRLSRPLDAARIVSTVAEHLLRAGATPLFKKTDSLLRGPVAAELEALAVAFGYDRVLLVAGNPALGRTVVDGRLLVNGIPLYQTGFAQDPHHPARSDRVVDLLGPAVHAPVHALASASPVLPRGLLIGDVRSSGDLSAWARRLPVDTLPAGGAAWCEALLDARGPARAALPPAPAMDGKHLLLSGTTVLDQHRQLDEGVGFESFSIDALERRALGDWLQRLHRAWGTHGRAIGAPRGVVKTDGGTAERIRAALAGAALRAVRHWGVRHLIVEGGSTGAAILFALDWRDLAVAQVWAPGVVSVRPSAFPECLVTFKPGSYPWPPPLARRLFPEHTSVSA